jgi:hypothetical protein
MTNAEGMIKMTKHETVIRSEVHFVIRISSLFRHSSFVIPHWWIKRVDNRVSV